MIKFPKIGSPEYSSLMKNLVPTESTEESLEKVGERIMLKAFMNELDKIASPWKYVGDVVKASLAGEAASELSNRLLYGQKAARTPTQIVGDSLTGAVFHAPFAAAGHFGPKFLRDAAKRQTPGTLAPDALEFGAKGLEFMKDMTSPIGTTAWRGIMPFVDYGLGTSPYLKK